MDYSTAPGGKPSILFSIIGNIIINNSYIYIINIYFDRAPTMRLDPSVIVAFRVVSSFHHKIIIKNPSSYRNRDEKPRICAFGINICNRQFEKWGDFQNTQEAPESQAYCPRWEKMYHTS